MFLDSDDDYKPNSCEVLYDTITKENVDMVFGTYNKVHNNGKVSSATPKYFKGKDNIIVENIDKNMDLIRTPPSLWTKIFREDFIKTNNIIFPEKFLVKMQFL